MKRIKADSKEGKALMLKYGGKIMQDGGKVPPEQIVSGRATTGAMPNTPGLNAEVEDGEYIKYPDGVVSEVKGKTHDQGGEKMNLAEGTQVLSDNIKLGKDFKNSLVDIFDVKLKANSTFATALDKIKKELGVVDAEKEQEKYVKMLEKNAEITDEDTKRVNEDFIASKLNETEELLQKAKAQESLVFKLLFEAQEQRKDKGEKNIRVEEPVQEEPEGYAKDGMEYGKMQDAGEITPQPETYQRAVQTPDFTFLAGLYDIADLRPEQKEAAQANIRAYLENLAEVSGGDYKDILKEIVVTGSSSTTPVSPQKRKELGADSNETANQILAQKRADLMAQLVLETAQEMGIPLSEKDIKKEVKPMQGPTYTGGDINQQEFTANQAMGLSASIKAQPIATQAAPVPDETPAQEQEPYIPPTGTDVGGAAFLPGRYRPTPIPLLSTQLNIPQARSITPAKVSPEAAIVENQKNAFAAMDIISQNVGSQQGGNLAQTLAQTQENTNKVVAQTNQQNAQLKMQADSQNQAIDWARSQAATRAMDVFGQQQVMALENTLKDRNRYLDLLAGDEQARTREMRDINIMAAFSPNYRVDAFGNINYIDRGDRLNYNPQNFLQAQALNAGNPSVTGAPKLTPQERAIIDYFKTNTAQ